MADHTFYSKADYTARGLGLDVEEDTLFRIPMRLIADTEFVQT